MTTFYRPPFSDSRLACLVHIFRVVETMLCSRNAGLAWPSCDDDKGVFQFTNGASMHVYFTNLEKSKSIEDALKSHKSEFSDYDMIFANVGSTPSMKPKVMLASAREIWMARVPFVWATTYGGAGDPRVYLNSDEMWSFDYREVKFFPMHDILKEMTRFTRDHVEGGAHGPHFCMPGPTNEIGLLWLQLVWASWSAKQNVCGQQSTNGVTA